MTSSLQRILSPRVTAVCGILGQLIAFVFILLAISVSPWFTWTGYALSNLGDLARNSAPLFNGGLLIGGVISVFFALGLGVRARTHSAGLVGVTLLVASALGTIGVAIFPMNFILPHTISAVAIFLCNSVALFVFGVLFALHRTTRLFAVVSFFLCATSVAVWFLPWGTGIAIPEFLAVLSMYAWIVIMSVRMVMGRSVVPEN